MATSAKHAPEHHIALHVASMAGGGAERVIAILANEFAKRGLKVDLVLDSATGEYLSGISSQVRVVDLRAPRVAASLLPLIKYLRRERPTCLLSTLTHVNLITVAAHRLANSQARLLLREATTLSYTVNDTPYRRLRRSLPHLARLLYPFADRIIAVSNGVAADLHHTWGVSAEKIQVIYNPLISDELLSLAAQPVSHPWPNDPDCPLVLSVGRLTRAKNYPLLLRAFAKLRKTVPARLMILGEGEQRNTLEDLARDLEIHTAVAMPGFVSNPFAYMARASVLTLSSSWEGLPGVLIQAMACGCPVVSTDCPNGPREILRDGRYGRLVPLDDPDALAEAMLAAVRGELPQADPEWMSRFSAELSTQQFLTALGVRTLA